MITAWIPLIVAIIGLLVYFVSTNAKVSEVGRIIFFAGVFFTVMHLAGRSVHIP